MLRPSSRESRSNLIGPLKWTRLNHWTRDAVKQPKKQSPSSVPASPLPASYFPCDLSAGHLRMNKKRRRNKWDCGYWLHATTRPKHIPRTCGLCQASIIDIVPRPSARRPRKSGSVPRLGKRFCLLPNAQTDSRTHLIPMQRATDPPTQGLKRPGLLDDLTTHLHIVPRLRFCRSIPPIFSLLLAAC